MGKLQDTSSYQNYIQHRNKMEALVGRANLVKDVNPYILSDQVTKDCNKKYKLLVLVTTHPSNFERRSIIRQYWGNKTKWRTTKEWRTLFITGGIEDIKLLNKLHLEAEYYKDILMEDVIESFYNLSYKVMIGLEWANRNFQYDYILKCDDDVFVQVDHMISFLSKQTYNYAGHVMANQPVYRKGRYKITHGEFSKNKFQPYCSGGGFILSFITVNTILPKFNWDRPLKIDDAYIGDLVHGVGLQASHSKGFHMWNTWCEYTKELKIAHPAKKLKCMKFLMNKSMIENKLLVNSSIDKQKYAYTKDEIEDIKNLYFQKS